MRQIRFAVPFILLGLLLSLLSGAARASTVTYLKPFGASFGQALGVDGNKVIGETAVSHIGFLYDGSTYTKIAPPGAVSTTPLAISGNRIVGIYDDAALVTRAFVYDGSTYSNFTGPTGFIGATPYGISGNSIVGVYVDSASKLHGFLYDGATWTTIDNPLAVKGTVLRGIDGTNIVGQYLDSRGFSHGFLYNGSSFVPLNDPHGGQPMDISGNTVVGWGSNSFGAEGFIFNGSTYSHQQGATFTGISGNRIVGSEWDFASGLDRPFVYVIPEPSTLLLGLLGISAVALAARRRRQ